MLDILSKQQNSHVPDDSYNVGLALDLVDLFENGRNMSALASRRECSRDAEENDLLLCPFARSVKSTGMPADFGLSLSILTYSKVTSEGNSSPGRRVP